MPRGIPVCNTTKTEFQRFLNENEQAIASLKPLIPVYRQKLQCSGGPPQGGTFGGWVRSKYLQRFNSLYKRWWLKRPYLFGKIYEDNQTI